MNQDLEISLAQIAKELKRKNQFSYARGIILVLFVGSILFYQWYHFQSAPETNQPSPVMYLSEPSLEHLQSVIQRNDLKLIVVSNQSEDQLRALTNNPKTLVLITSQPIIDR